MKKNILLNLVIIATFLSGCKKIAEKTQFDMTYNESVIIESSTGINLPFNIASPDIETNSESTFAVNDTRKDLIEEISLTSLKLDLTSPNNADFSFLESVAIFISAEGLEETRVAWNDNVPNNAGNSLNLSVTKNDLKEYIKKDDFDLRVNTITDEILTSDHKINITLDLFVDAEIFGQ